jgi:NAD(P)-dependent dehydrogenase (short-subunit alcohol dehydrogenase family)
MPQTIDLAGRAAVVTGASGELGRVIARTLGEAGAFIPVCGGNVVPTV